MTQPTIEAARDAPLVHGKFGSSLSLNCHGAEIALRAAARVILEAEPSEAEIEAFAVCAYGPGWDGRWHPHAVKAEKLKIRDCLKARDSAKAKEMGL